MAFRAEEAAERGYERARNYLVSSRDFNVTEREAAERKLLEIIDECGPVVDAYPSWHPLVRNHSERYPQTSPNRESGYEGIDHTIYFAHGFITCPYHGEDDVVRSAHSLPPHPVANITAERLDVPFYHKMAKPVLVRCEWSETLDAGHMIPKRWAVPLMMEQELPGWRWSAVAETWETMRPYLLGQPHGNRSSLFVSQETAIAMKKLFVAMTESGMYGPLRFR